MGQIITRVKVTLDIAGGTDIHYNKWTVAFDGTKQDLNDTVAKLLNEKKNAGEFTTNDLRGARIEDDTEDKDGIFGDFIGDVKGLLSV